MLFQLNKTDDRRISQPRSKQLKASQLSSSNCTCRFRDVQLHCYHTLNKSCYSDHRGIYWQSLSWSTFPIFNTKFYWQYCTTESHLLHGISPLIFSMGTIGIFRVFTKGCGNPEPNIPNATSLYMMKHHSMMSSLSDVI